MKKKNTLMRYSFLVLSILLACGYDAGAQAPALLNYQGVARNAAGVPLPNQNLSLRVNIRAGSASGQVVFSETRSAQTNSYGLFSVQIGSAGASSSTGTLAAVNWAAGSMFMELELDPNGGSSFVNLGTTQLLSVPYALSALTAAPTGAAGGDLIGTYPNPTIADKAILTSKIGDLSVTDNKIAGVSGSKVTGDISGNAANVTGIVAIANGGTGASTAAQARINLGLGNASADSMRFKLNTADTAAMLLPYRRTAVKIPGEDLATAYLPLTGGTVTGVVTGAKMRLSDTLAAAVIAKTGGTSSQYLMADGSVLPDSMRFKLRISDTAAMLLPYRRTATKISGDDLATAYLPLSGGTISGTVNGAKIRLSDTLAAAVIAKAGGNSSQYLMADGSVSTGPSAVREVADEFSATASQSVFTLSQSPGANSKVKMFINGIRISNTAYTWNGVSVTYVSANNGGYVLSANDRIQFDYYY